MNRRGFAARLTAVGASVGLGRVKAGAAADLIGTWRIVSYEDRDEHGKPSYPYGERPIGLLIYDASGHMAVQLTRAIATGAGRRSKASAPGGEKPESAYTAYFGTYSVDWERRIITHAVEGNLFPVFVGTKHERPFELDGDRLVLAPRWEQDGARFTGARVFVRLH